MQFGYIHKLLLLCILFASVLPVEAAKPGDTIFGRVASYDEYTGDRNQQLENARLAKAAYAGESIPQGYRAATRNEFYKYVGLTSQMNLVYNEQTGQFSTLDNYGIFWDSNNGLAGSLLVNESDGSLVLAFRGTDKAGDWGSNLWQGVGGVPEQYEEAAEILQNIVRNSEEEGKQINVVGHSLGGGLAAYSTIECDDLSRVTTTTFNAAGLYPTNIDDNKIGEASRHIANIRVDDDPVSGMTGLLVGDTYVLDSNGMADNVGLIDGWLLVHGMDTVISLMENGTLMPQEENYGGEGHEGGDACYPPNEGNEPGGDQVCYPGGDGEGSHDDNQDNDEYYADDDTVSGGDNAIGDDDEVLSGGNGDDSYGSGSGIGDALVGAIAENFPIIYPSIPHYRMLWLFAGEDWIEVGTSVVGQVKSTITDLINGGDKFKKMGEDFKNELGVEDFKDLIRKLGN